jgi:hypothetical protein
MALPTRVRTHLIRPSQLAGGLATAPLLRRPRLAPRRRPPHTYLGPRRGSPRAQAALWSRCSSPVLRLPPCRHRRKPRRRRSPRADPPLDATPDPSSSHDVPCWPRPAAARPISVPDPVHWDLPCSWPGAGWRRVSSPTGPAPPRLVSRSELLLEAQRCGTRQRRRWRTGKTWWGPHVESCAVECR